MATMQMASQFNRPIKNVRLISLTPLARIFQPGVDIEPYLENPDLWKSQTDPFEITIVGSWATRSYKSGTVVNVGEDLAFSYVGLDNSRFMRDHDYTGLVYFDVSEEITASLDYQQKTGRDLPKDITKQLASEIDKFKVLSHKRVLEHAKRLYNSMVAGRNALKEAGKTPPEPNEMELLIAFILRDEVQRMKARRAKLTAAFEQASSDIGSDVEALLGE